MLTQFNTSQSVYVIQKPLGRQYSNISKIRAFLASFNCLTTSYFGYTVLAYADTDPTTFVKVNITIMTSSKFSMLGFSILIINKPFDPILQFFDFQWLNSTLQLRQDLPQYNAYNTYLFIKNVRARFTISTGIVL